MKNQQTPIVIFSPEHASNTRAVNALNVRRCVHHLLCHRIPFKQVDGAWEGKPEKSFAVHASNADIARALAEHYGQDAVLYLDGERVASLGTRANEYQDDGVSIGRFVNVSEWEAKRAQGYTHVNGQYYVVK